MRQANLLPSTFEMFFNIGSIVILLFSYNFLKTDLKKITDKKLEEEFATIYI